MTINILVHKQAHHMATNKSGSSCYKYIPLKFHHSLFLVNYFYVCKYSIQLLKLRILTLKLGDKGFHLLYHREDLNTEGQFR